MIDQVYLDEAAGIPPDAWTAAANLLYPEEHAQLHKPVEWVNERCGEFLWSKQREISESVRDNRYTAVPSCHDSGKSFISSRIMGWWLDVHPPGTAFVVSTAPTTAQIDAILWREASMMHDKANLPGRITLDSKWYLGSGDRMLVGFGRRPADSVDPEKAAAHFQGIHAKYVLVIIDEAGGIPKWLFDAVDSLATNENARVLAVGNPTDPTSHFATVCKPGSGWNVIRIDGLETPNFTDEEVPEELREFLLSKTWVEERKKRWGETSPRYISRVRGRFPKVTDDTLIQPGWIEDAITRELAPDKRDSRLGVDVARYGADETIIYLRQGGHCRLVHQGSKDSLMVTAGWVIRAHRDHTHRPIPNIDDVGLGGGVTDRLAEQGYSVVPLNGGEAPINPRKFGNARSEWYWALREVFQEGLIDIDPNDEDLAAQLGAIKFKVDSRGRIWVETKDEMKKRGLPSPDRADGLCYSWIAGAPLDVKKMTEQHTKTKSVTGDLMEAGF